MVPTEGGTGITIPRGPFVLGRNWSDRPAATKSPLGLQRCRKNAKAATAAGRYRNRLSPPHEGSLTPRRISPCRLRHDVPLSMTRLTDGFGVNLTAAG
jgi:hypothetical protein